MTKHSSRSELTLTGCLSLRTSSQGSKSERLQPCLRLKGGEVIFLHVDGENPFEEPTLRDLLGSQVQVTGKMKHHTLVLSPENLVILKDEVDTPTQENKKTSATESTKEFPEPDNTQVLPHGSKSETNGDQSIPDSEPEKNP